MDLLSFGQNSLLFVGGLVLVGVTLLSAIQTFILPRAAQDPLVKFVFKLVRKLFDFRLRFTDTFDQRERIMAFYAPFSLMVLLPVWYFLFFLAICSYYRAAGAESWYVAFARERFISVYAWDSTRSIPSLIFTPGIQRGDDWPAHGGAPDSLPSNDVFRVLSPRNDWLRSWKFARAILLPR